MELSMEADDDHNCSDYQRPKTNKKKSYAKEYFPIARKTLVIWQKEWKGQQKTFPFLF